MSIQTRLLAITVTLILITVAMISGSGFFLLKKDKQRESQERIQIGFDVISDDLSNRLLGYTRRFDEFLEQDIDIRWATDSYDQDKSRLSSSHFIVSELAKVAEEIKKFGSILLADRLTLYGRDRRLLIVYRRDEGQETVGGHIIHEIGGKKTNTYVSMDDLSRLSSLFFSHDPIPHMPLPEGVEPTFSGDFPDNISVSFFTQHQQVGFKVIAPIRHNNIKTAVLVGEVFLTQAMLERYANLSKTHLNIFAGNRFSVGTLAAQKELNPKDLLQVDTWDEIHRQKRKIDIIPVILNGQTFYQGRAAIRYGRTPVGAMTVSLSQDIEKTEIRKILTTIFIVSMVVIASVIVFFLLFTRKTVLFIQQVISYIDRMSKGDIPDTINEKYKGEFELVRNNLNRLIHSTNETTRIAEQIAAGSLTGDVIKRSEHDRLMNALDLMNQDLEKRVNEKVAELRQARNYITNIIDSMPSVLIGVDAQGKVTQWNKTAEQITGITAGAAEGTTLSHLLPGMASLMEKIFESIRTRKTKQEQKQPRRVDGVTRYEDVTIYPLIANGSEGAVIRIDDVTNQVRMEEMMIQNEKMLSVGGLAAGMAHEINNPMAGMIQTANVLSSRLTKTEIPANRRAAQAAGTTMEVIRDFMEARGIGDMLATINESGQRVAEIVTNMLSFARKSESVVSSHDLSKLLDKTLELAASDYDLKKQFDFKMIEIQREYEENLPPVPCEGAKIQQVLLNILRNGAQAMQKAETVHPRFIVRAGFEKKRGMVRMEIEDNGPGMDATTRKRIFEPFFTTKPEGEGTGLGLSVSYFIITENHGGEMVVESEPGRGAKFIIRLPLG